MNERRIVASEEHPDTLLIARADGKP